MTFSSQLWSINSRDFLLYCRLLSYTVKYCTPVDLFKFYYLEYIINYICLNDFKRIDQPERRKTTINAGLMNPCSKIKLTCSTFVLSLRINRCLKCLIWDDLFRSSSGSMNASHLLINTQDEVSTGWKTSWLLLISSHGNKINPKVFFH